MFYFIECFGPTFWLYFPLTDIFMVLSLLKTSNSCVYMEIRPNAQSDVNRKNNRVCTCPDGFCGVRCHYYTVISSKEGGGGAWPVGECLHLVAMDSPQPPVCSYYLKPALWMLFLSSTWNTAFKPLITSFRNTSF